MSVTLLFLSRGVREANGDTRLGLFVTFITFRVLQTEAGFVAFCHFGSIEIEEVVKGEDLHAVVMPTHIPI